MIMADKKSTPPEERYTREALASSVKYRAYCDVLIILLEADKEYTFAEADQIIEDFKSKPVVEATVGKE
nr:MAG TPA: hypothetical protein [Caudoviricetes sp.]